MNGQTWQLVLGLLAFLGVVVGIVLKLAANYLRELREDIEATKALDIAVSKHGANIDDILRRLTLLEGGIQTSMLGVDRRLTEINNSVIKLEAGLHLLERVEELVGNRRASDRV